ncbi:hypothetical protein [Macromonas nakdongensis]|uniref:hypothetical protein n=1 Tax=Macromonas nakdongensis TaxID=1843082 RepID=UPI0012FF530B|nr:hypothetical protein [Macromonas nakdongensis]
MSARIKRVIFDRAEDLWKAFGKFMKNKSAVRFVVFLRLHFADDDKPYSYSLKGSRGKDGRWMYPPPDSLKDTEPMTEEQIRQGVKSIVDFVDGYVRKHRLEKRWEELLIKYDPIFRKWGSVEDCLDGTQLGVYALVGLGYNGALWAPMVARQFALEAIEALQKSDHLAATILLGKGMHWIEPGVIIPDPSKLYSERARSGGKALADKDIEPIKKLTEAYLLQRSDHTWGTFRAVAEEVSSYLIRNHEEAFHHSRILPENLPVTLVGWFRESPERFLIKLSSNSKRV